MPPAQTCPHTTFKNTERYSNPSGADLATEIILLLLRSAGPLKLLIRFFIYLFTAKITSTFLPPTLLFLFYCFLWDFFFLPVICLYSLFSDHFHSYNAYTVEHLTIMTVSFTPHRWLWYHCFSLLQCVIELHLCIISVEQFSHFQSQTISKMSMCLFLQLNRFCEI